MEKIVTRLYSSAIIIVLGAFMTSWISLQINSVGPVTYFLIIAVWSAMLVSIWYLWRRRSPSAKPRITQRLLTLGNFNQPDMKKAICDNIRANLALHGSSFATIGNKKDAQLVKWVIDNEYVPREDLERAVHEGICQVGRSMFEWHRRDPRHNYPDYCLSPEALGYAMKHKTISSKEIASIRFDHGETSEEYIKSSEGLLEKVMCQLCDGTAFFDLASLAFPGDSCLCHD